MVELFIILAAVLGIVYFSHRHRERMTIIKKGDHTGKVNLKSATRYDTIRLGLFLIGIAFGFVFGAIFDKYNIMNSDIGYISMLLFCGGLSLVIGYLIEKKETKVI